MNDAVIQTYSALAENYDDERNRQSCWGRATASIVEQIRIKPSFHSIADVGCGTGWGLLEIAGRIGPDVCLTGLEPAENMRRRAAALVAAYPNVRVLDGRFERMPLKTASIDYLFSNLAFHWTTDLDSSVAEIARVLKPEGEADLTFIGRHNGEEFIRATTPIFLKHMGPARLLESAAMRKQLTLQATRDLFGKQFDTPSQPRRCTVEETYTTVFDTLDGHWHWWVRIEGQFVSLPPDKREACDREIRQALARLEGPQGIPYTLHLLHVRICGT